MVLLDTGKINLVQCGKRTFGGFPPIIKEGKLWFCQWSGTATLTGGSLILFVFLFTLWDTGIAFPPTLEQKAISKHKTRIETIETKLTAFAISPPSFCWQLNPKY